MNKEFFEKQLRKLIQEAQKPGVELVNVDNSTVQVKKGKAREFDNLAALYYSLVEHPLSDEDYTKVDYAAYVFDLLKNKPKTNSPQASKLEKEPIPINESIQNLMDSNSRYIKKLSNLQKSYNIINTRYEALTYQKNRLIKMNLVNEVSWQFSMNDILEDLQKYGESKDYLIKDIAKVASEINNKLAELITKQMQNIEASPESDFLALNGKIIPNAASEEYHALLSLLKMCQQELKTGDISIINKIMCVASSDVTLVEDLFMKTNLFAHQMMKKNNEIVMNEIKKEQLRLVRRRRGESKPSQNIENNGKTYRVLDSDAPEYLNLLAIYELLEKANNSKGKKAKVGAMYVLDSDANTLINLMKETKYYKDLKVKKERVKTPPAPRKSQKNSTSKKTAVKKDLDSKQATVKIDTNNQTVKLLEEKIDNLATQISTYKGTTNLPIAVTNPVLSTAASNQNGNKIWAVPIGCLPQCNYLVEAINILNRANGTKLTNIGTLGYVNIEDKKRFQDLISATNGLDGLFPANKENEKKQAEILRQVTALIAKAKQIQKNDPAAKINPIVKVLEEDLPTYNRLKAQYQLLENARFSNNVIPVNGALIDKNDVDQYIQLDNSISIETKTINPKLNIDKLNELMALCQDLVNIAATHPESEVTYISGYRILKDDIKLFKLLGLCGVCLIDASESNNLVPVGENLYVDAASEKIYAKACKELGSPAIQERLNQIKTVTKTENTSTVLEKNIPSTPSNNANSSTTLSVLHDEQLTPSNVSMPKQKRLALNQHLNQIIETGLITPQFKEYVKSNSFTKEEVDAILSESQLKHKNLSNLIAEIKALLESSVTNKKSASASSINYSTYIEDPNYQPKHLDPNQAIIEDIPAEKKDEIEEPKKTVSSPSSVTETSKVNPVEPKVATNKLKINQLESEIEGPKKIVSSPSPVIETSNVNPVDPKVEANKLKISQLKSEISAICKDIKPEDTFGSVSDNNTPNSKKIIATRNMSKYFLLSEQIKLLTQALEGQAEKYDDVYLATSSIIRYQAIVAALNEEKQTVEKKAAPTSRQPVKARRAKTPATVKWWQDNINNLSRKVAVSIINCAYNITEELDLSFYSTSDEYSNFSDIAEDKREQEYEKAQKRAKTKEEARLNEKAYKKVVILTKVREYLDKAKAKYSKNTASEGTNTKAPNMPNQDRTTTGSSTLNDITKQDDSSLDTLLKNHTKNGVLDEQALLSELRAKVTPEVFEENPVEQARKERQKLLLLEKAELDKKIGSPSLSYQEAVQIYARLKEINAELKALTSAPNQGIIEKRVRRN